MDTRFRAAQIRVVERQITKARGFRRLALAVRLVELRKVRS